MARPIEVLPAAPASAPRDRITIIALVGLVLLGGMAAAQQWGTSAETWAAGAALMLALALIVLRQGRDRLESGRLVARLMARERAVNERTNAVALDVLQEANGTMLRAERIAHVGHWRLDTRTGVIVWSDEVRRIHDWPETEALARKLTLEAVLARVHPEDRGKVEAELRGAVTTGQAFTLDFRILRPGGDIRHIGCFGEPEHDGLGRLAGILATVQDVTERVRLEEALRHEQKMKTIGRLASGVAHDFNNLLQSITGCLELIGDTVAEGDPAHEYVRIALGSAERGSYLTYHLLSYARKQVLKPAQLAVPPLLRDMQVLLERTLGPHIRVVTEVVEGMPAITVDPGHLQTALLNLGINAGHAMALGGTLTLRAWTEETPDLVVVIAVLDTGTGMDPATLAQAAEPFFTTKGVKGTGLGLSMVNGFAQQSGGTMRIVSRVGEGTRIELRLPGVPAVATEAEVVPMAVPAQGNRALVIDDASDVLITTVAFLAGASMQVVAAGSGETALDLLRAGDRFNVLVTDYAMPGLDGVETIRAARSLQPGLPAVLITGYANVEGTVHLPANVQLLRKPFARRDFLAVVQRALEQGAAPAAMEADGD